MNEIPNIREALLLSSGFFIVFCLAVTIFTTWSRAVQREEYNFTIGQYASLIGMFCFAILFTFGYSLPKPAGVAQPKTVAGIRSNEFNRFFDQCLPNHATTTDRTDCMIFARQSADAALGIKPLPVKVVWKDGTDAIEQRNRREGEYDSLNSECRKAIGIGGTLDAQQLEYCGQLADVQTDAALGVQHFPRIVFRTIEKPNSYDDAYKLCMGDYSVDGEPNPVQARNDRIKLCHAQAKDVVANHL